MAPSRRRQPLSAIGTVVALVAALLAVVVSAPQAARADMVTSSGNPLRTGWDRAEPGLSPSSVTASDFGQLYSQPVNGQVYAQPLVVRGTVFVATENNVIYGFTAATGQPAWTPRSVGAPWPASEIACGDLVPNIGITATPVYDPTTDSIYFTSKVNDGATSATPHWYMHAVDPATGAERPGWPVTIAGSPSNDPSNVFNPRTAMQRPGLLLIGGVVYAGFASHCDHQPYVGYVAGFSTTLHKQVALWATEAGSSTAGAGVWQSGGGLVSDGAGRILLSTGNGVSPPPGPGTSPPSTLAESVVRLAVGTTGQLSAEDYFSPVNNTNLDRNDTDLGSGGPMALPDGFGSTAVPHLLVQVGKDGRIFLLNRDNLGGTSQGANGTDKVVGITGPYRGVWGHPAFWGGDGGYVYTVENQGYLRALKVSKTAAGVPALASEGTSAGTFGYTSGSPVVTSDGTTSGSALVWAEYTTGSTGTGAQLRAYDARPVNGVLPLRFSAPIGVSSKFAMPATDGGRVFVGTRDGKLLAFGRPVTSALTAGPTDFGQVEVGQASTATAVLHATRQVTVNALTTTAPFATAPPSLPVTLAAGSDLRVAVSFSPTEPGPTSGSLAVSTDQGDLSFDLRGTGTKPGLAAGPASLSFGDVPTGGSKSLTVNITNTGTATTTVNSVTAPVAPFASAALPAVGTAIAPGATLAVTVTFAPSTANTYTGRLVVGSADGDAAVTLTGTGVTGAAHLTVTPAALDFGSVPVGRSVTKTFDISNTGNLLLTITKAAPPAGEFSVASPISEGQQLEPGDVLHQSVTFTPTTTGPHSARYLLTGDDGRGPQDVTLSGTATTQAPWTVPAPNSASWHLNGSTVLTSTDLRLTPAAADQAGSAVYPAAVATNGLHARFTTTLGGGTGADGLTFTMLDPATSTVAALGRKGGALGYGSLHGVAVTLDTFRNGADPSSNFVGVATGATGTNYDTLTYKATANLPTSLRTGAHTVDVLVGGGRLTVTVDGLTKISPAVTLPANALLAFTAGTGRMTDAHTVRGVTITTGTGATVPAPAVAGWRRNGVASATGSELRLTPAVPAAAGTVIYPRPEPTAGGLHASFTAQLSGGTGADGLAFVILDATKAAPTALGAIGSGLGCAGLPGVAITLDTYRNAGEPSANFVGVATSSGSATLTYLATSSAVPNLRTGTHRVDIHALGGTVTVSIDTVRVVSVAVVLPPSALIGFSAGTGGLTDAHVVRSVAVASG